MISAYPPHRHGLVRDRSVLLLLIGAAFLMGGGSRADVMSLIVLRPLSALACAYAIWRTDTATLMQHRWVIGFAAALAALPALHLVPLPPAVWTRLPGRDVLVMVDDLVGIAPVWRPLTMAPNATANALFSLLLPTALLLLALRLDQRGIMLVTVFLISLIAASAALGILQLLGGQRGPLYLYRITNDNSAVGLFANRNHQAVLLATAYPFIGLVLAAAGTRRVAMPRFIAGAAAACALVIVILATGSRAGVVLGIGGLAAGAWLAASGTGSREALSGLRGRRWLAGFIFALLFLVVTCAVVLLGRAEAIDRVVDADVGGELRLRVWGPVARLAGFYLPWGSGVGAFVESYQMAEPNSLLSPSYLNHAHNDWLEVVMTGGLPAFALLLTAIAMFAVAMVRLAGKRSDDVLPGRAGLVVIAMLALASAADYPLRVPSLMAIFAIMVAFVSNSLAIRGSAVARA